MMRGGHAPLIPRNPPVLSAGFKVDARDAIWFGKSGRRYGISNNCRISPIAFHPDWRGSINNRSATRRTERMGKAANGDRN